MVAVEVGDPGLVLELSRERAGVAEGREDLKGLVEGLVTGLILMKVLMAEGFEAKAPGVG